ncbi:hypothetical protein PMG11_11293 [Penicillium brasilianum]|uniref:Uncharacterized protein n=1 Tax=Penicillium brasilianum TaxID=104259 RepID=A0A0F7U3F8_PENBI|nr:hypothetical protein PMG11_11293 [Penicillium brasilianum]
MGDEPMSSQPSDAGSGHRPFPALRSPSSISKPTNPATQPDSTTPHRNVQPLFRISTTYSTTSARALSFQGQVVPSITPLQLAENGLYFLLHPGFGGTACCFACQSLTPLYTFQRASIEEVEQLHKVDCIWQIIRHDLRSTSEKPDTLRRPTINRYLSSDKQPSNSTTPTASTQSQNQSRDLAPAIQEAHTTSHLNNAPNQRTATRLEPQLPHSTRSPQPLQSTATTSTTSATPLQRPTYATVLQQPTITRPQPTPTSHQSVPPKTTLTIEDLHLRFHNKPSPFKLEKRKKKRPNTAFAAQSLSRFLNSALPAFSRFLAEMQPAADNSWPAYMETQYNRAMRAA